MDTASPLSAIRDFAKAMHETSSNRGVVFLHLRDMHSFPRVSDWSQKYYSRLELDILMNKDFNPGRKLQIQEIIKAVDLYDPTKQAVFVVDDGTGLLLTVLN